jgi:hypothetical protein
MRKFFTAVSAFFIFGGVSAQQNNWCTSMDVLQHQIANNPAAKLQYDNYIQFCKDNEFNYRLNDFNRGVSDTIYIPVVFHIIHDGDVVGASGGENISDAQIFSQIDAFNKYFSMSNENAADIPAEFKSVATATKIRFCLAITDPSGNPTTGIIRHNLGAADWDQTDIDNTIKPSTIWDRNKYLNIWSVRAGGTMASSGVLAYAQFPPPWGGAANTDGLVARYNTIGAGNSFGLLTGYNKGKTLVHEAGHWLGLFHIWGDDNGKCAGQSGAGSDNIGDTPDQADQYFGFPTYPQNSCGTSNMFMNFMDYTNDDCSSMFTVGQVTRMQSILDNARSSLKSVATRCFKSLDLSIEKTIQPSANICFGSFKPVLQVKNKGLADITNVTINYAVDGSWSSYPWTGFIPALGSTTIALPSINGLGNGAYTFQAIITDVNTLGADNVALNDSSLVSFSIADAGPGFSSPYTEGFESGFFPPSDWTIENPNNDAITWKEKAGLGSYSLSNTCIWINNYGYTSNPNSPNVRKDAFVLQDLDLTAMPGTNLSFDYAYAKRGTKTDTLQVSYSLDCGATWNAIWKKGGAALATSTNETVLPFLPETNEWNTITIPLSYLGGQQKVRFKFENATGWGNALYIDNININRDNTSIKDKLTKVNVSVFPNPSNGLVTVKLPDNHQFEKIQITDALGRIVKSQTIIDPISIVRVADLAEGVYTINLLSVRGVQSEKLVIAR